MNDNEQEIAAGAAGAPEGAVTEPTSADVQSMYDELGIKATAPTGKAKGRPKAANVRGEDLSKDGAANSKYGREEALDGEGKSKNARASADNGGARNGADAKGSKVGSDSRQVQGESEEADGRVRGAKPGTEGDSKRRGEKDAPNGDNGAGQAADDTRDEEEEGEDFEEGKRPGKSNPKIEQRFQKLSAESKAAIEARDAEIEKLRRDLEVANQQRQETHRQQQQAQFAKEDPEYTVDDFRKVRDENNNILELDENQAELAWRRWKDGYEQRKSEREAQFQHEQAIEEYKQEASRKLMESSVQAYDTLTGILDSYPELDSSNPDTFDQAFSDAVMPIIEDAIIYQQGTEPGNPNNYKPVIIGLHMNPQKMLQAMNAIRQSKRNLPLNGVNDNVESRSNVHVPHGRSSDETVNAANELYKELGIKKRL